MKNPGCRASADGGAGEDLMTVDTLIAGGTVVMPILNYGTDAFDTLVSLRGSGLAGIKITGGNIRCIIKVGLKVVARFV